MHRKKDIVLAVIVVIFVALSLWASSAFSAWEYAPPPKPAEDIVDGLIATPRIVLEKYGRSDRTVVMFNLVALQRACQGYEKRIKDLEGAVAALKAGPTLGPEPVQCMKAKGDECGLTDLKCSVHPTKKCDPNEVAK